MLCDQLIIAARNPRQERVPDFELPYLRFVAGLVEDAERFHLDHEAVDVVLDVQETKPSSLIAGLGICRLPFPKVWIEFDLKYRMDAMARYGYIPTYPKHFTKVARGMLLVASDDTLTRGQAYFVASENGSKPIINPTSVYFDFSTPDDNISFKIRDAHEHLTTPTSISLGMFSLNDDDYSVRFRDKPTELAALAHMENLFLRAEHPYGTDWLAAHHKNLPQDKFAMLVEALNADYAGEPRFILGIMMLLNSRNLAHYEERTVREKNRMRGVRAGRAVVSHRTVTIKLSKVSQNRMAAHGMNAAEMAYSKVRGHWKVRKTGVFFWRPHARGARSLGEITHDYAVTA